MKEQIHKEIASLQQELSRLEKAVDHINDAKELSRQITSKAKTLEEKYSQQIKEVQSLTTQYNQLVHKIEKLLSKIDNVNFPQRLDKLDTTVSSINQGLQNVQAKLENLGRDIKDEFKKLNDVFTLGMEENRKTFKSLRIMIVVLLIMGIGLTIITVVSLLKVF